MLDKFTPKERRNNALTVRLPKSVVDAIKEISKEYDFSQSEVIEILVRKEMRRRKRKERARA